MAAGFAATAFFFFPRLRARELGLWGLPRRSRSSLGIQNCHTHKIVQKKRQESKKKPTKVTGKTCSPMRIFVCLFV
jgi:hypothetical protein